MTFLTRLWTDRAQRRETAVRLVTLLVSLLLLAAAHHAADANAMDLQGNASVEVVRARVEAIAKRESHVLDIGDGHPVESITVHFYARILDRERRGEMVFASQSSDPFYAVAQKEIAIGDQVLLHRGERGESDGWMLGEYVRTDALLLLVGTYVLLFLLLGGWKGFWALTALALTCGAIFAGFLPSVLSGGDIRLGALGVCGFSIASTLLLVSGASRKTLTAGIGCAAGVGLAGVVTLGMDHVLMLTGYVDEQSVYLASLPTGHAIDLRGVIFAGILIGALGAVMDVAMSIASALWELQAQSRTPTVGVLLHSGLAIGRDMMGTMANTLVLAYIGGSLSIVLLLTAYATSTLALFNMEMIVVEVLQALVGSLGILLTIPLTSLAGALLYGSSHSEGITASVVLRTKEEIH
ncbi:MAG: YibE/F family protein [Oscillospiraceae bacterium]